MYGKLVAMEEGLKISEFSIKMTLFLPLNDMTLHGHHSGKFVFQSQKPAPRSSKDFFRPFTTLTERYNYFLDLSNIENLF